MTKERRQMCCVSGMVPHKTYRGKNALSKLKVFEGVPPPYDKTQRVILPAALRYIALKPRRKVRVVFFPLLCNHCSATHLFIL